jgi:PII-like signaling protein
LDDAYSTTDEQEAEMNGYQLTFYTEQNRKHGHETVCEWLLSMVKSLGIRGVTVISAAEGIGHAGARHAAHLFQLADQPVQVTMAVTEEEAELVLSAIRSEKIHLFYVRFPVEFGMLGDDLPSEKTKRLSLFHRAQH